MKIKQIISFLRNLYCVPRCGSCDERLSPIPDKSGMTYGKICLCNTCQAKWEMAKAQMCHKCGYISEKCTCTPKFLTKFQSRVPSLCFYHPNSGDTQSKIIITMKRRNQRELFEFMAIELYPKLKRLLEESDLPKNNIVFTWVPRSRAAEAESGFDQGRVLANATAAAFGAKAYPIFLRTGGKEQKKLSRAERKKNAEVSIKINSSMKKIPRSKHCATLSEFLKDKTVIIIDDVLTSGSTLRRAIELLEENGHKNTVVACIAKSEEHSDKK